MGSCRRACQQRFDSPEAWRNDRDSGQPHELLCGLDTALYLEAHHSAKTIEQLACSLVSWVTFETGVVHTRHCRMSLQMTRDLQRASVLMRHAQSERLHPAV